MTYEPNTLFLDDKARSILENESGLVKYSNGAIYKFDDWEQTGILSGSNAKPVPYKSSLSNVYTGFEVVGYEGTGWTGRSIHTKIGCQWIKNRDSTDSNVLSGPLTGKYRAWFSDLTEAMTSDSISYFPGFTDESYDVGSSANLNTLTESYITWNWSYPLAKAWHAPGGTSRKVPTPWGIVDSVESNASSGITGDQVVIELYNPLTGNGCLLYVGTGATRTLDISGGITPEFMIAKTLSAGNGGYVYHSQYNGGSSPGGYYIPLNSTTAEAPSVSPWQGAEPTSSMIYLGTTTNVNYDTHLQILYYFAPVAGLQNFGGYVGNGVANNQATNCKDGMFFIKKRGPSGQSGDWMVFDDFRTAEYCLQWNVTNAESYGWTGLVGFNGTSGIDLTTTAGTINADGHEYVYGHFGKEMVIQGDIDVYPTTAITSTTPNNQVNIYFKYKGSATPNSELFIYATRTGGLDWVQLTIEKLADINDDYQLLKASGNIETNAVGTDMRWRLRTVETPGSETEHNIKDLDISWK